MKTIFLFLLLLVFTNIVYCQKDCKLEIKKDQFTGETKVYTKDVTLMSVFSVSGDKYPWHLDIYFSSVNDTAILELIHGSQVSTSAVRRFYAKFTDGTIFTKEYPDNSGAESDNGHYKFEFTRFPLTKEELEMFTNKTIQLVKVVFVYFPDMSSFDKEVDEKKAAKIQAYAKCLLTEMKK
jgi:predicted ABC-type exoprotein transport system permease subunit